MGTAIEREFDVKQAAVLLRLSELTIRRMLARREIGYRRTGSGRGRIRIGESHITEYLSRRTVPPVAA